MSKKADHSDSTYDEEEDVMDGNDVDLNCYLKSSDISNIYWKPPDSMCCDDWRLQKPNLFIFKQVSYLSIGIIRSNGVESFRLPNRTFQE